MLPVDLPLFFSTNADHVEEIPVTNNGEPVDLTGYLFQTRFKRNHSEAESLFELNTVAPELQGWHVIEPTLGVLRLRVNAATLNIAFNKVSTGFNNGGVVKIVHDLLVTHPDGLVELWAQGVATIRKGIS